MGVQRPFDLGQIGLKRRITRNADEISLKKSLKLSKLSQTLENSRRTLP